MKTKQITCQIALFIILSSLLGELYGQGPGKAYYYYPEVELPWAACKTYFEGGSQMKIPFLPVICYKIAPMGTDKYSKDIDVSAPVVFVGNGISKANYDCYKGQDVKDKFVMFYYDYPDTVHADLESETSLVKRIDAAFQNHVAGIVLISWEDPNPFLVYDRLNFDRIESDDFEFCFRGDYISEDQMKKIISVNQESVTYILDLFK